MFETLFTPGRIGMVTIPNRVVMEPLQNYLAEPDGCCSDADVAFYARRAKGGVGLIQTGTVCVDLKTGRANERVMALDRDDQIPSFRRLTEAVHRYGTVIFAELYHPGRQGFASLNGDRPMLAPSVTQCALVKQPTRAMTEAECQWMTEKFVSAAQRAQNAGFDGVTLHCAHGYLLHNFLSPYTNHRTDAYGGSSEGRAKLVVDIIRGIRARCGGFPILVRMNGDDFLDMLGLPKTAGITKELAAEYARIFIEAGADAIDVSAGIYETMNTSWEPSGYPQGWKAYLAKYIRSKVSKPVICTSVIRDAAFAEQLIQDGTCDFVGSARAFLADPDWVKKSRGARVCQICPCISCLYCFSSLLYSRPGMGMRCTVNPEACQETHYTELKTNGGGRTVVIAGGGLAGMECARVLALRRFHPIVLERSDELGGQLHLAHVPPEKYRLEQLMRYFRRQMEVLHVDVRLNTTATPELIRSLKPEGVIIATGSKETKPRFPAEADKICSVADVLSGKIDLAEQQVAVVGCGATGMEVADYLAEQGAHVTLCDRNDDPSYAMYFQNYMDLRIRLAKEKVAFRLGSEVTAVTTEGCQFADGGVLKCDRVVLALGTSPNQSLTEDVRLFCEEVAVVGDAGFGRNFTGAMLASYDTAYHFMDDEYHF